MNDGYDDEDDYIEEFANFCPDCDAMFFDGEEGHDSEVCIECGECNCYEVPA